MTLQPDSSQNLVVILDNVNHTYLRDEGIDIGYFSALQSHVGLSKSILASTVVVSGNYNMVVNAMHPDYDQRSEVNRPALPFDERFYSG
uniref:Uncharacterized protein n=1 Tax=Roseihalotalea indica TaxID=2867963 RepID=A0AA49GKU7_9BACT|nr:hypothetical protein K4G66_24915 [Tunicatimonas sp. TK19036]